MTRQEQVKLYFFKNNVYDARFWRNSKFMPWLEETEGETLSEKVWLVLNERPKCHCGKFTAFINFNEGYRNTCCYRCAQTSDKMSNLKKIRHSTYWDDPIWAAKTTFKMQQAHHKKNTERKLLALAVKGFTPIDFNFTTTDDEYQWEHRCGQIFSRHFKRVSGFWCPVCHVSKGQGELYEFIIENYKGRVIANDRQALCPKEIDVYLPELKLGFEFNGKYWHRGDGEREAQKVLLSKENDIDLIDIWEVDWIKNKKQEKDRVLKHLLGS